MDPTHFDKIADKLMQYKGKLPDIVRQDDELVVEFILKQQGLINDLLSTIDTFAKFNDMGWVK